MDASDAHPRLIPSLLVGALLVWSVASLATADSAGSSMRGAVERIGPLTLVAAIASDGPTTRLAARAIEHLDALTGLIAAAAVTRSALLWVIGDLHFPASLIATSRLVVDLVRRGPPRTTAS